MKLPRPLTVAADMSAVDSLWDCYYADEPALLKAGDDTWRHWRKPSREEKRRLGLTAHAYISDVWTVSVDEHGIAWTYCLDE